MRFIHFPYRDVISVQDHVGIITVHLLVLKQKQWTESVLFSNLLKLCSRFFRIYNYYEYCDKAVIRALELSIILLMSSYFDEPFDFGWRLYVGFATKLDSMTLIHFDSL